MQGGSGIAGFVERVQRRVDQFFEKPFSETIFALIQFLAMEEEGEVVGASGLDVFVRIYDFSIAMNVARKVRFNIRRTLGNSQRNAPCPCGSGMKYKQCCAG
ncbi:MAG: SEC-C domain-containing protein [Spirochaetales bacterium]|nr:SEC-C domain-containing protein [Spirochaetales bacterium]